ncbi:MAG: 23S rRNA (adenine(2503)-C(2))-methyltransferase RlmN [Oscillospiraceae bacterium]|nr:23S rRNA (adenine(2503)-C(2))-methyltransferase RlmN [Oscillospiraceae bacterium]
MQIEEKQVKPDIKSMLPEEIKSAPALSGEPQYRAGQIFKWLSTGVTSFDEMTDLSKTLRTKLKDNFTLNTPVLIKKQISKKDASEKYLWRHTDDNTSETVVMKYKHGNAVCVSTQVGCKMGCVFCASAIGGFIRDLTPSEMLDEVIFSEAEYKKQISRIVLMGIGEPLDNYDNVVKFIKLVNHKDGKNIGMRRISLSTCGLTEKFDKLGELNLQLTLSVSLHAPDDETRSALMPINKSRGTEDLFSACRKYFANTGRRITFEYTMIDGVNDSREQAALLAEKLKETNAHLNLIPLNIVNEREFRPSSKENMLNFIKILEESGANVTVRRSLGGDVDASCGQLRIRSAQT